MKKIEFITIPENAFQVPFRLLSTLIVRVLARTPVSPNQVTVGRAIVAVVFMYFFAQGDWLSLLVGVALFYVFEVLDHVDGDLARHKRMFSPYGPKLEQFVDTWASRPSSIFGFCFALGVYNNTGSIYGFVMFLATVFGRLFWLEYRDYFGWVRTPKSDDKEYIGVLGSKTFREALKKMFSILYIWNNTFLLLGALLYVPVLKVFGWDSVVIGFAIVAVLNNLPWMFIVVKGFRECRSGNEV